MAGKLKSVLKEAVLRRLAGETRYLRGSELHEHGHVTMTALSEDEAVGSVLDGEKFEAALFSEAGELDASCECEASQGGLLCEHGVAVGLEWLKNAPGRKPARKAPARAMTDEQLAQALREMPQERLVRLTLEVAASHPLAAAALRRATAIRFEAGGDRGPHLPTLKQAVAALLTASGSTAARSWPELRVRLDQVMKDLRGLIDSGSAFAAMELAEDAIFRTLRLERSKAYQAFPFRQSLRDLGELHAAAVRAARPAPQALAARLVNAVLQARGEFFRSAATDFAEELGRDGLLAYRESVDAMPARSQNDPRLAECVRGLQPDLLVAVDCALGDHDHLRRFLDQRGRRCEPRFWLELARLHIAAGRMAEAIEAAKRGIEMSGNYDATCLKDFLVNAIAQTGRKSEALEIAWKFFSSEPRPRIFLTMRKLALESGEWTRWRAAIIENFHKARQSAWFGWYKRVLLAAMLFMEGEAGQASDLLRSMGYHDIQTLLNFAQEFNEPVPQACFMIRLGVVEHWIRIRNYASAIELLSNAVHAARAAGIEDAEKHIERIRREHAADGAFLFHLDRAEEPRLQ
jgi:tetratricopeptide (TPR) repeat protein